MPDESAQSQEHPSNPRVDATVISTKYMTIDDFAEMTILSQNGVVGWLGGFFMMFRSSEHYDIPRNVIHVVVDRVFYSPGEYHNYILAKLGEKAEFREKYEPGTNASEIKVLRHEDYEQDVVSKAVLDSITKVERGRKEYGNCKDKAVPESQ